MKLAAARAALKRELDIAVGLEKKRLYAQAVTAYNGVIKSTDEPALKKEAEQREKKGVEGNN